MAGRFKQREEKLGFGRCQDALVTGPALPSPRLQAASRLADLTTFTDRDRGLRAE